MSVSRSSSYADLSVEELLSLLVQKRREVDALLAALLRLADAEADSASASDTDSAPPLYPMSADEEDEEEHTDYTASEVAAMTDEKLLTVCIRIFRTDIHPHSGKSLGQYVGSIRNRCIGSRGWRTAAGIKRWGLSPEMPIPETDSRQTRVNNLVNGTNNPHYRRIREARDAGRPEDIDALQVSRAHSIYASTYGEVVPRLIAKELTFLRHPKAAGAGAGAGAGAHH